MGRVFLTDAVWYGEALRTLQGFLAEWLSLGVPLLMALDELPLNETKVVEAHTTSSPPEEAPLQPQLTQEKAVNIVNVTIELNEFRQLLASNLHFLLPVSAV